MNSRNPFTPKMEIGSSSKQPTDIGSSTSLDTKIGSSRSVDAEIGSSSNQPKLEETITDPYTKDIYLLDLEIGSFSNGRCRVYRALFYTNTYRPGGPVPRGYVTLKIINMNLHQNEFKLIQRQLRTRIYQPRDHNVIRYKRAFIASNLLCVCLPYMSEGSLRSILSTRPEKKLPEKFIPVVLKEVLVGLGDELHDICTTILHNNLNAGDIFVNIDNVTKEMSIKLAFELSAYDSEPLNCNREEDSSFLNPKSVSIWGAAPEVFESDNEDNRGEKSDIWLLGMMALELVYGNLPVKNRTDLNYIINKIREKKKFPKSLEKMMIKRDKKLKKVMDFVKRKKRVFSREFEEMVLACLRENPDDRPSALELLRTPFFSDIERFKQFMLNDNN